MSVMTSADDLLKTRTIPELRKLVYSLSSDADGKQSELRSMVRKEMQQTTSCKFLYFFNKYDKKYFVYKQAKKVRNYHNNLLKSVKGMLAIMGLKSINQLNKNRIIFIDKNSKIHDDIDKVFERRHDIKKDKKDKKGEIL